MKWKSKQSGRLATVLGDEIENGRLFRFFAFDDHPNILLQWDLLCAPDSWDSQFEKVLENEN